MTDRRPSSFTRKVVAQQLYEAAQYKGEESEAFVEGLFESHTNQENFPPWLLGWNRHKKFGHQDMNGIDITVYTDVGEIHVNVKSSYAFVRRFMRLHGDKGIVVFVVDPKETSGQAFGRLITTINKKRQEFFS